MSDLFMEMQQRRRRSQNTTATTTPTDSMRLNEDELPKACIASATMDDDDPLANILSLKLKKPKGWNWELSTSRSCTNIALPRILLYDHKGNLLVDANSQEEKVYKPTPDDVPTIKTSRKQKRTSRTASANMLESILRPTLNREFSGLQIEEVTPSPERSLVNGKQMQRSRNESPASIEFQTTELPDYKIDRRSSSFKEVRFKMDNSEETTLRNGEQSHFHIIDLPTPPSTSTTTTTNTSSSSGPREKRRYRRSQSSSLGRSPGSSESILERFSYTRGRYSSPEYAEEHSVEHAPRYLLRTSKAGTLVVKEESFSRYRRRRKLRNSSAENLQNESSSKSRSSSCLKLPISHKSNELQLPLVTAQSVSLQNVAADNDDGKTNPRQKKSFPVRRYKSDGNILLHKKIASSSTSSSSSSSDAEEQYKRNGYHNGGYDGSRKATPRRYSDYRKQSRKGLVAIDSDNAIEKPTAR